MPITLHPHLKRTLSYEDHLVRPEHVLEARRSESLGPDEQITKRRRIETIAAHYMRGQRPLILSAKLHGPFQGWASPWSQASDGMETSFGRRKIQMSQRSRVVTRNGMKEKDAQSSMMGRKIKPSVPQNLKIPSPEASRALDPEPLSFIPITTLDNVDILQITDSTREQTRSENTEFFSVPSNPCTENQSQMNKPFWLRRRSKESSGGNLTYVGAYPDSPLRPKSAEPSSGRMRLTQPKLPPGMYVSPLEIGRRGQRCSSASATIALQSSRKQSLDRNDLQWTSQPSSSFNSLNHLRDASYGEGIATRDHPRGAHDLEEDAASSGDTLSGRTSLRIQSAVLEISAARSDVMPGELHDENTAKGASVVKQSSSKLSPAQQVTNGMTQQLPRVKCRYIDFNFSPISTNGYGGAGKCFIQGDTGKGQSQESRQVLNFSVLCQASERTARAPCLQAEVDIQNIQSPTEPSETPRALSQPERETPPMIALSECAFNTTPPAFKVHRGLSQPTQRASSGSLASTQDLLGAASPFVASAGKKTSRKLGRSSLRHSMMSLDQDGVQVIYAGNQDFTSPVCRIPLKEKNLITRTDPPGTSTSQVAQKLLESPMRQSMTA